MAMWITDLDNNPVRTLLLVGKRADWQKDNFIWWSMHRSRTERLVSTRSMSTSGAGVYNVFWDGVDDAGNRVAAGKYVLHVETSRERGKHTHRSLTLDFGKFERFKAELPPTEEGGGLRVGFDHY
jgi:thiamine biosynthesis lipoprotein